MVKTEVQSDLQQLIDSGEAVKKEFAKVISQVQQELSKSERTRLEKLESTIEAGRLHFFETCNAFFEIEQQQLWRDYKSFHQYCLIRWDVTLNFVSRYRDAALVLQLLKDNKFTQLPTNEGQARSLARLLKNPDKLIQVWRKCIKSENITAALISEIAGFTVAKKSKVQESPLRVIEARAKERKRTQATAVVRCSKSKADLLAAALNAKVNKTSAGVYSVTCGEIDNVESTFSSFGKFIEEYKIKSGQFSFAVK